MSEHPVHPVLPSRPLTPWEHAVLGRMLSVPGAFAAPARRQMPWTRALRPDPSQGHDSDDYSVRLKVDRQQAHPVPRGHAWISRARGWLPDGRSVHAMVRVDRAGFLSQLEMVAWGGDGAASLPHPADIHVVEWHR